MVFRKSRRGGGALLFHSMSWEAFQECVCKGWFTRSSYPGLALDLGVCRSRQPRLCAAVRGRSAVQKETHSPFRELNGGVESGLYGRGSSSSIRWWRWWSSNAHAAAARVDGESSRGCSLALLAEAAASALCGEFWEFFPADLPRFISRANVKIGRSPR